MYFQRIMKSMKEYLDVIKACGLFAGVEAGEAEAMLGCLGARKLQRRKGEYIFHAGERAESMGILLAGNAFVVHESFWGDRHIVTHLPERLRLPPAGDPQPALSAGSQKPRF